MKTKLIIGILVLAAIAGLFYLGKINRPKIVSPWEEFGVDCLPSGHSSIAMHIHPQIEVFVNGEKQVMPANIGIEGRCMSEVHTHDTNGEIHIESTKTSRRFVLEQFFNVWGEDLEKDGYDLEVLVNGQSTNEPEELILRDLDRIVIRYKSDS